MSSYISVSIDHIKSLGSEFGCVIGIIDLLADEHGKTDYAKAADAISRVMGEGDKRILELQAKGYISIIHNRIQLNNKTDDSQAEFPPAGWSPQPGTIKKLVNEFSVNEGVIEIVAGEFKGVKQYRYDGQSWESRFFKHALACLKSWGEGEGAEQARGAIGLDKSWSPGEEVIDYAVKTLGISPSDTEFHRLSFIIYWSELGTLKTQSAWCKQFITYLSRKP